MSYAKFGKLKQAGMIIHGGAGPADPIGERAQKVSARIRSIGLEAYARLQASDLLSSIQQCLQIFEDDPLFNAGYGSALQADGLPRLSASMMDGRGQVFSGIVSVPYLRNPSRLVEYLQTHCSSRVLTNPGAELLARQLGLPLDFNQSPEQVEVWRKTRLEKKDQSFDTVGCVIYGKGAELVSGSSTGGRGFEWPGRVSDSCTAAGNYCSAFVGVTATGVGEEIVDDGLCVRIETRVRDGMTLENACRKTLDEALARERSYGWIAIDQKGHWAACTTTSFMSWAVMENASVLDAC